MKTPEIKKIITQYIVNSRDSYKPPEGWNYYPVTHTLHDEYGSDYTHDGTKPADWKRRSKLSVNGSDYRLFESVPFKFDKMGDYILVVEADDMIQEIKWVTEKEALEFGFVIQDWLGGSTKMIGGQIYESWLDGSWELKNYVNN